RRWRRRLRGLLLCGFGWWCGWRRRRLGWWWGRQRYLWPRARRLLWRRIALRALLGARFFQGRRSASLRDSREVGWRNHIDGDRLDRRRLELRCRLNGHDRPAEQPRVQ